MNTTSVRKIQPPLTRLPPRRTARRPPQLQRLTGAALAVIVAVSSALARGAATPQGPHETGCRTTWLPGNRHN